MHKIIIVGAGELGSRHLQGLLQSKEALDIIVVDPSDKSIQISSVRAEQVGLGNVSTRVSFVPSIPQEQSFELAVIATSANVRFDVFELLVTRNDISKIIFEKVLFQKEEDFSAAKEMLSSRGIDAWVNCPRRMFPVYQDIKAMLQSESDVQMKVSGSCWGLACNGIHFIDLFSYLSGESEVSIGGEGLTDNVEESKRVGFYEVFGVVSGKGSRSTFELSCVEEGPVSVKVEIKTPNFQVEIFETAGTVKISSAAGSRQLDYQPLYQSQLTNLYVEQIIADGTSSLTSFDESSLMHIPFLSSIKAHIETHTKQSFDFCPIT